jgi:hypothetical protein
MNLSDRENRYPCDRVVPIEQEPRHHLVIENQFVRAFAVEIAPHECTLCHHHPHDYLVYVAGDAEIVSAARGQDPKVLSYRDGDCELSEAGMVHVVENLGERPFRNIVAELLPGLPALRRGANPKLGRGAGTITPLFQDERTAIFEVGMKSGSEVELEGPAVVATPYGASLTPEYAEGLVVKHNRISDLSWIPQGRQAILWGSSNGVERAIVFQFGRAGEEFAGIPKSSDPRKRSSGPRRRQPPIEM